MISNLIIYIKCFIVYNILNELTKYVIKKINNSKYNDDRNNYISKNISKSLILFYLCKIAFFPIVDCIIYDNWNNDTIYLIGILYSSHDILSLIRYYRILPKTTKIHHISVLILSILNLFNDYKIPSVWRGLVSYAFFSALAFYVNTFLGMRFLISRNKLYIYSKLAYFIYGFTCLLNWSYQIYIIYNFYNISYIQTLIFMNLIGMLVYDDIILLKFLKNY